MDPGWPLMQLPTTVILLYPRQLRLAGLNPWSSQMIEMLCLIHVTPSSLFQGGKLEIAKHMAGHESARTTGLLRSPER